MDAIVYCLLGLTLLVVGVSALFDIGSFGTKLMRLSLYANAPIWSKAPGLDPDRVHAHRLIFGSVFSLTGVAALIAAVSSSI